MGKRTTNTLAQVRFAARSQAALERNRTKETVAVKQG